MKRAKQTRQRKQKRQRRKARRPAKPYEFLDHPADVGFIARGRTLPELFANAARAMLDYGWELTSIRVRRKVRLAATGSDLESLLYNWLSELLSRADAEGWAFKDVQRVTVHRAPGTQGTRYKVEGTAMGEPFVRGHHRARTYLKAVTYHQLSVKQVTAGWPRHRRGWQATVYLDV